jgi:GGDEF domain-containing protein
VRPPADDSLRAVDLRPGRHADSSDPRDEQPPPPVAGRAAARAWPDQARSEPEALWVGALADEIRVGASAGTPVSLLLAELEDADRLIAVEGPTASAATFGEFGRAVRAALRRRDILVCETDGRVWVIARDTGRPGAQALGARISEAVRGGPQWRGAPMVATIGVAVLGEDGRTPSELIEAAEEARFAAAASGVDLTYTSADGGPEEF